MVVVVLGHIKLPRFAAQGEHPQRLFFAGVAVANDVKAEVAEVDRDLDRGVVDPRDVASALPRSSTSAEKSRKGLRSESASGTRSWGAAGTQTE